MYEPQEDSMFFAEFLEKYFSKLKDKNVSYLDMGCGSGILSETARNCKIKNILAVDVNKEAIDKTREKGIKTIKSNLFSTISKKEKFDIITFNAPYLPSHKYDKQKDTTGGEKGDEISLKFIKQAKPYLKENGKIFLLISSLTPQKRINKFKPQIAAKKKLFFEELIIFEISFSLLNSK